MSSKFFVARRGNLRITTLVPFALSKLVSNIPSYQKFLTQYLQFSFLNKHFPHLMKLGFQLSLISRLTSSVEHLELNM